VRTVGELIGWLSGRGEGYAYAFEKPQVIRAAIDQSHVKLEAPIAGACEVALFPPMTGG
jgi:molybdopterin synthase sulfur carrier subunit